MNITVSKIAKGKDGKVHVSLNYPGALNVPSLVFEFLPKEIGIEFFEKTNKKELDKMRGAPDEDEEDEPPF